MQFSFLHELFTEKHISTKSILLTITRRKPTCSSHTEKKRTNNHASCESNVCAVVEDTLSPKPHSHMRNPRNALPARKTTRIPHDTMPLSPHAKQPESPTHSPHAKQPDASTCDTTLSVLKKRVLRPTLSEDWSWTAPAPPPSGRFFQRRRKHPLLPNSSHLCPFSLSCPSSPSRFSHHPTRSSSPTNLIHPRPSSLFSRSSHHHHHPPPSSSFSSSCSTR